MVWTNWLKSSSNWCFFWLQMPYKNSKNCSQRCGPYAKRNGTLESGKHLSVTEKWKTKRANKWSGQHKVKLLLLTFNLKMPSIIDQDSNFKQIWIVGIDLCSFFFFLIFSHVWNEKNRMLTILGNKCWMLGQLLGELDCLLNFCTGLQVLRKM